MKISAHPAAWQLAYQIIDQSKPGGVSGIRIAVRVQEAIAAATDITSVWPNPWANVSAKEKEQTEKACGKPMDASIRADVDLSHEQVDHLLAAIEEFAKGTTVGIGRALVHLIDRLSEKRKG